MFTSSEDSVRSEFCFCVPSAPITYGLGSTPARTVCVPGLSPAGVLGLQPDGLSVMPNEIVPPATPT